MGNTIFQLCRERKMRDIRSTTRSLKVDQGHLALLDELVGSLPPPLAVALQRLDLNLKLLLAVCGLAKLKLERLDGLVGLHDLGVQRGDFGLEFFVGLAEDSVRLLEGRKGLHVFEELGELGRRHHSRVRLLHRKVQGRPT